MFIRVKNFEKMEWKNQIKDQDNYIKLGCKEMVVKFIIDCGR